MATLFRSPGITRIPPAPRLLAAINWAPPSSTRVLIGQDKFFGAAGQTKTYDWPNPRGRVPSIDLRTFLNPMETQLIGQDKFFGAAGQPPANLDWPVPKGPKRANGLLSWQAPNWISFNAAIVLQPFFQSDWPNPLRREFNRDLRTFLNQLEIQLIGQDQFFGLAGNPNFNWPNPRGYVPSTELKTFLHAVQQQLIGKDQFFGLAGNPNFNWPIPRGAQHPVALRTYLNSLPPLLAVTFLAAWAKQEQLIGGGLYVP